MYIVAHFAADQVDAAIAACGDAFKKIKALSQNNPIYSAINCGFGLTAGAMIEGNIGSSIKMDFTALGSMVDPAVYLGVLARDVCKPIAISESIQLMAAQSWGFESLGEFAFTEPNELAQVYALAAISES